MYNFLATAGAKYGVGFWRPGSGIIHQVKQGLACLSGGGDLREPESISWPAGQKARGSGGQRGVVLFFSLAFFHKRYSFLCGYLTFDGHILCARH